MKVWSSIRNGVRGALASVIVYPLVERIEGRSVRPKSQFIRAEIDRPFPERRARAWTRLVNQVNLAATSVPYYRDLFSSIAFDPESLSRDPKYLEDIPYLTKEIIREQGVRLLSDDRGDGRVYLAKTGGSTGPSADIYYDGEAADWSSAITRESRRRIGNSHWRSELHFASKFPETFPLKARMREAVKCFAMNRDNVFFESFDSGELEHIWEYLKWIGPDLVHAHPSTIDHLASHVETTRGSDRAFRVFESSGELMERHQRERIARILRCEVIDRYGLAEAGVVAYQLDMSRDEMMFYDFFAWPETRQDSDADFDDVAPDNEVGELVITPLFNKLMPLLRYRTGDNAVLVKRHDGIFLPRMIGRIHDVVSIGGRRLPTHYIQDVLDRIGGIREFQIEMRDGQPIFRIVPEIHGDPAAIVERLRSWWGPQIGVEFVTLSDLKRVGRRQKFRHLVADVSQMSVEP